MDDKLVPNVRVFMDEEIVDPVVEEEEAEAEVAVTNDVGDTTNDFGEEIEAEEDPAAEIVEQIKALEDEDPGAEIDAKIMELKAEAELVRLSEDAVGVLEGRLREIWLAEFTEAEQAKLRKSFIPGVRAKGKKKLLPIKKITDLRFFAEGSEAIFYLSLVKQGHFHLKVFHKPGA